jgi:endonuclease/exonuclease/phosphatase (EEP) superfamily protein YafD
MRNKPQSVLLPNRLSSVKPLFTEKTAVSASRSRLRSGFFWLNLATWALLLAVAVGQLAGSWYPFELLSHFQVPYAVAATGLLAFWTRHRRLGRAGLALVSLLWSGALLAPWVLASPPPGRPVALRVLHANVFFKNPDYPGILALIQRENADLCVIHEATPSLYAFLRQRLNDYPYRSFSHAKRYCWILVLSRTPFTRDSAALRDYRAVALRIRVRGREVALVTVHPRTPLQPDWFASRNRQLRFVFDYARRQSVPTVLVGDFNITPWSPVYRELTAQPGLEACRKGFGLKPTWISPLPIVQLPIDHVFAGGGLHPVSFRTLPKGESDHRPVVAELGVE